ncbi:hypothetical protein EV138_3748 [Kribbella voronezhensis]|uniref:Uncharacterized protein n=1 Tax=Kribbella voronezhensis TaxID=2512212 RepID=A0A4R7TDI0_9ACTN|nr:hypothetical protein EV138_3748 [Kribbella voronezhensis]
MKRKTRPDIVQHDLVADTEIVVNFLFCVPQDGCCLEDDGRLRTGGLGLAVAVS